MISFIYLNFIFKFSGNFFTFVYSIKGEVGDMKYELLLCFNIVQCPLSTDCHEHYYREFEILIKQANILETIVFVM